MEKFCVHPLCDEAKASEYFNYCNDLQYEIVSTRQLFACGNAGLKYSVNGQRLQMHRYSREISDLHYTVQSAIGLNFNCMLVEKISDGSKRVFPLQDCASYVIVTFGSKRTHRFVKNNVPLEVKMSTGSMVLIDGTYLHEIISDNAVTQEHFIVTFLNLNRKRKLPTTLHIDDDSTGSCYQNIKSPAFEKMPSENQSACELSSVDDKKTVFKCSLEDNIYMSVEYYNQDTLIHIRKFVEKEEKLYPTRIGVTMQPETWYAFYNKLSSFTLAYKSNSFIANNEILVLNLKNRVLLQSYRSGHFIHLNKEHIANLIEYIDVLNEQLLNFKYNVRLPQMLREVTHLSSSLSSEIDKQLEFKLIESLAEELAPCFNEYYFCDACQFSDDYREHRCVYITSLDKLDYVSYNILSMLSFSHTIREFTNVSVSEKFFDNICFRYVQFMIQKYYGRDYV